MSDNKLPVSNQKLALENCCAQQVVHSMFEHVADQAPENLENRADRNEIAKFSTSLIENEFIFGSPNELVLATVEQKISAKTQKNRIS